MELWDVYDQCFRKTGRVHERGKELARGDYHLVVHIYPVNDKKEILIQKRSDTVAWKPGSWAATGGSAIKGEDMYEACIRELNEEVGILAEEKNMELFAVFKRESSYNGVWIVRSNVTISELTLQEEEVSDAKWATSSEIKEMVANGEFHSYPYLDSLLDYIDEK
ncbi:NUDIX hydrolase [Clostridium sp. Marseille-P299]|uniref:NUDIX hydrolase n=1 Tax=Clostridium sp. Marseille-P299 TaxID=1805477 RepID=UPI00082B7C4E|nr:NUDIX domain-containing protein [Clostridium sp. Marseille-P299]